MPHILPTSSDETIGEKIGDFYPVFNNAFARSAQSAEMLQNALWQTDRKRRFVYDQHYQSAVLFFYYLCLEA